MADRHPTESLTNEEAARIRDLIILRGARDAARIVGLCDERTVRKAGVGEPIGRLTATVIRQRLSTL